MLFWALLGLAVAIRHAREGDLASVVAYGILAGLVQGTKGGGAWMIPLGLAAACWGHAYGTQTARRFGAVADIALRMLAMGAAAATAYVASTPYIFFDPEFFEALRTAAGIIRSRDYGGETTLLDWLAQSARLHQQLSRT